MQHRASPWGWRNDGAFIRIIRHSGSSHADWDGASNAFRKDNSCKRQVSSHHRRCGRGRTNGKTIHEGRTSPFSAESSREEVAGGQRTSYDRGFSPARWWKAQTCRQADNGRPMDFPRTQGRKHCSAADGTSQETKCSVDTIVRTLITRTQRLRRRNLHA